MIDALKTRIEESKRKNDEEIERLHKTIKENKMIDQEKIQGMSYTELEDEIRRLNKEIESLEYKVDMYKEGHDATKLVNIENINLRKSLRELTERYDSLIELRKGDAKSILEKNNTIENVLRLICNSLDDTRIAQERIADSIDSLFKEDWSKTSPIKVYKFKDDVPLEYKGKVDYTGVKDE